jgi:hypothetical protein
MIASIKWLHLQKHPYEATDMLNLFKTMIIPIILLAPILHIWLLSQWQL